MIFKLGLISLLISVSLAGQCWWCRDALISGICNKRRTFDGDCVWSNSRCIPKSVQNTPTLQTVYTTLLSRSMRCKQRNYNQCVGLDSLNPKLSCQLNPSTVACEATDVSYPCSTYTQKWRCDAAYFKGCIFVDNRCF